MDRGIGVVVDAHSSGGSTSSAWQQSRISSGTSPSGRSCGRRAAGAPPRSAEASCRRLGSESQSSTAGRQHDRDSLMGSSATGCARFASKRACEWPRRFTRIVIKVVTTSQRPDLRCETETTNNSARKTPSGCTNPQFYKRHLVTQHRQGAFSEDRPTLQAALV